MTYLNIKTGNEFTYKNLTGRITCFLGGLSWVYTNSKKETLSIVLHRGSYGGGEGEFEIMPSWRKPSQYDDVDGWLDFGEVQKWIDELSERGE